MLLSDEDRKECIKNIISLCNIPSPSGFTKDICRYLMSFFTEKGYQPYQSNKGSVVVDIGGEGNPLVLAAHIDTLGAMVRAIKSNGNIRYTNIGGYPANNIENETCKVHTRSGKVYEGTFYLTTPATHVYRDIGGVKRDDETIEVVLDENVENAKDVEDLGIAVGDFISIDPRIKVAESGYLKSRHLDDKASAGILMTIADYVQNKKVRLNRKVYLLFTTYEEVGHGGASGIPSDTTEMISVDMGCVGSDLTANEKKVSICAKDSGGPYDYDIVTNLTELAKKLAVPYAVDIYPFYGSDVEAALSAGHDIRHGLLGPGVFASHGYERTHLEGLSATLKLLIAYIIQ
ncbi:MAG: M42 family metallopeptidase [Candidatus Cloacimonetes bacterium]|nr:M42 family metallopeptidase [Candidatus Cloacimonadota bacterium]